MNEGQHRMILEVLLDATTTLRRMEVLLTKLSAQEAPPVLRELTSVAFAKSIAKPRRSVGRPRKVKAGV